MIPIKEAFPPCENEDDHKYGYYPWKYTYEYDEDQKEYTHKFGPSYPKLVKSMEVDILAECREDAYQGDWFFVVKRHTTSDFYGWLVCGFGSCSGCDALEGAGTYEDLEDLRQDLWKNTRWFPTLDGLITYLQENLNFQPGDPSDSRALIGIPRMDYYWHGNTNCIREIVEKLVPQVN